uniref:Chromodomain helicase DNA binding protein 6 n=1 Tax=Oreochromis niloticus TaxID=8128 RepID=A0A669AYM1_ORENI
MAGILAVLVVFSYILVLKQPELNRVHIKKQGMSKIGAQTTKMENRIKCLRPLNKQEPLKVESMHMLRFASLRKEHLTVRCSLQLEAVLLGSTRLRGRGEADEYTSSCLLLNSSSLFLPVFSHFLPLLLQKRRSGRQVKRRKYNEDLDFKVVDDDGETIAVLGAGRIAALNATALAWQAEEPPEDEANIIEKILAVKTVKKEKDPRIHQKIKRFRTKQAQMKHLFAEPDEDLFNPDYVEVDRVLEVAVTTDTETGEEVTHYLVKWCSLSYEEATWELQEDLDPEKIKEFEEIQKLPERPSPEKWQKLERSRDYRNGNQLREYQLEGMNWLLFNWYNRKNCILADEMGLGKTIQSITFLYEIFSMGIRGPFLIIAPLSTITNWEREFRTWTHMNVIVYHGSQISRQMILQYEMFHRDPQGNTIPGVLKFHGLITTFEMIMADCPELKKLHWRCVVIDEAHRLKNRNCKLLEGLKLMNLEHKVLLTGTPLQNSVEELFSLLNFLEPLQFPSESTFLEEFGDLKTDEQVKKLQAILKPMMLRRLKDDVEKNLAPKEETIIEVELTNIQKKYYRAILEKNFSFLSKGANQHNMPNLINTMMELRKCCNHPYLITGAEEKILESFKKSHSPEAPDFQLQAMIQAAGKLVLIDKLLPKLLAGGHKVLVFSQMVRCLDILEDYLIQRRYTYERIDGRVRGNLRQAAIDRFCKPDSDRFVFLLCTRAGGLGINLTAADTCIIFDSDWNPQNDLQAQARCHRIGQSKAVKVYRLITRNSYEREMFDKASLKLGLDKAVLQDINRKGSLNGVQQLSKLEVEDLLKKGAYGALMDEEDEGSKFCEEDIDQILQRRTQTITIQSEGKGSTFAKASFISSGNRTDISLDDPNFWQKWAKIAEVEIDSKSEKESLVIDTPRVRKQTRHYNSFEDDELMEFSELDSDSEERPCRTRRLGERSRRYLRAECFRVEKNLLIFGWGRWKDILNHGRFKWHLTERDMEVICRALLVYCLRHYKGDDKIKSFIWDLITPTKEGQDQALVNHSGLSAPVPRGRKGKKLKNQLNVTEVKNADWLVHCNPEVVLQDESYKKHLKQHCNKVLLRVRMLYYLKVEVLGEAATQALEGVPARYDVPLPDIDYIEIPVSWWDAEADKSLLIGVHKHGYERYNAMRADPDLCFLERVGMPDVTALSSEQGGGEVASDIMSGDLCTQDGTLVTTTTTGTGTGVAALHVVQARPLWPTGPALTARLRRLITAYQRFTLRLSQYMYLFSHFVFFFCFRWTRREQADFYRTVSSFGVVYDPERKAFDWSQFRALARLERKTDESLERYFNSFVNMCRTACKLPPRKEEGLVDPAVIVEPLTEERAARTLYRIELLRKIREQVLRHPLLSARLQLCRPSLYLPVWWESGKHDRDLLIGAARHGLSRTDFYILNDPQLSFLEAHRNYHKKDSPQDVHSYLGKLEQEGSLSIEEPTEEVEGLILYQTVEERSIENSLDTEALMCNTTEEFVQMKGIPKKSRQGSLMGHTDLADQVDEISEGQEDNVSPFDVPVVRPCDEEEEKRLKQLDAKTNEMELGSIYSQFGQLSCPSVSVSSPTQPSNSTETTRESNSKEEAKNEASMAHCKGSDEDLNLPDGSRDYKNNALKFCLDQDSKDNLLDQNEIKMGSTLAVNNIDTKPSDLKFSHLPDGDGEEKPEQLVLPVKIEDTKTETIEDVCPDSSEVKHTSFFSYPVKSEGLVTKAEQLEYPIKPETLETKPEDLSFPMKPEHLDTKPEFLQFVAYAGGSEVKSEVKPLALGFSAYPESPKLKTEAKPEDLRLAAFPETAAIKPEAKAEGLGFTSYPESSEIKPEAKFAAPISVCEIPDSLHETREPTIAQLLQEKALYSFSEWPKDRVIINRLDSICHAILKGKWPSSSEQYDSPALFVPCLILSDVNKSTCQVPEAYMPRGGACGRGAWRLTSLPLLQERLVAPPFLPELKRAGGRRSFDYEAAAAAAAKVLAGKSASSCHTAVTTSSSSDKAPVVAPHKIPPPPPITAPLPGPVGIDMAGILQAGLIHPVTGQIVNGSLRGDDSMRRRRGRRRNVEALYSEFTKSRGLHLPESQVGRGRRAFSPEIVAIDREAAGKGLIEWLRQNPGYTMDLPAFAHVKRPKQRRHRCKDPTKLDINSLTGEERVPVVHRGTGRRGFLPEGKFSRILTEPVNKDPSSRRRGRRPRSEMPKPLLSVSDSSSPGLGPPLFMNGGLIGSMDSMVAMQNLRSGIPGIPISGIMAAGFPHGFPAAVSAGGAGGSAEDAKNGLSMLPMMLHGIPHPHGAAIPQHALFSVGTMMAHTPPPPSPHPSSSSSTSSSSSDRTAHLSSAHLGAGTGSHLTFNPFLIPGMSHGLLYPHMFLPHGGIMALPAMPPGAVDGSPGSPKRRKKRGREEGEREEEREKAATGDGEERENFYYDDD